MITKAYHDVYLDWIFKPKYHEYIKAIISKRKTKKELEENK